MVHDETKMCSHKVDSILEKTSALSLFHWIDLMNESEAHSPTLLTVLNSAIRTQCDRCNRDGAIGMCVALLLSLDIIIRVWSKR